MANAMELASSPENTPSQIVCQVPLETFFAGAFSSHLSSARSTASEGERERAGLMTFSLCGERRGERKKAKKCTVFCATIHPDQATPSGGEKSQKCLLGGKYDGRKGGKTTPFRLPKDPFLRDFFRSAQPIEGIRFPTLGYRHIPHADVLPKNGEEKRIFGGEERVLGVT